MKGTFLDWPICLSDPFWIIYTNVHERLNNWFQQRNLKQHLKVQQPLLRQTEEKRLSEELKEETIWRFEPQTWQETHRKRLRNHDSWVDHTNHGKTSERGAASRH